jgi:PAS domain S-box-containing protein
MFQHIYRARRDSGDYIVIEAKGKLVRDENNMPVKIVGTAVDITERQQMEDALRKSQAQLSALIENREEAIWSVDTEKRILNFNRPIAEIFKSLWGVELRQGNVITDGLPVKMAKKWTHRYDRCIKGSSYSFVDEFILNEKKSFVEFSLNPLHVENGSILGVSVLARNITPQKAFEKSLQEAKEAAEAANSTKSQFLANMSHEIRTPMNGIIGFAELLLRSRLTAAQREYLGIVRHSADTLLILINDLLDISKIESGKLELVNNEFNFHALLKEVVRTFQVKTKDQQLKIVLRIDKKIPPVIIGDEMRLRQVFVNLIGNSVKFSKNGTIRVHSLCKHFLDKTLTIYTEVTDEGIGIEKEKQNLIFEPFNQIDDPLTRQYGGTGLGLSIAKKLVNMMHGEIGVDSEPGKGSKFHFTVQMNISGDFQWKEKTPVSRKN